MFEKQKNFIYIFLVSFILIVSVLVRLRNFSAPLLDWHLFRQTQTATTARNFFLYGIDIFHPRLDILGIGKSEIVIMEFPLYQALVAFLAHFFGFSDGLGRVTSIFFGLISGLLLLLFVRDLTRDKFLALTAFIIFLFFPLNLFFHRAFMIESMITALFLISLYCWFIFFKTEGRKFFILAVIMTSISLIQKNIYAPYLCCTILCLLQNQQRKNKNIKWWTFLGLCMSGLLLLLWQFYSDKTNLANGNLYFTFHNPEMAESFFGRLSERFSIFYWQMHGYVLYLDLGLLSLPLIFLGFWELVGKKTSDNKFLLWWVFWSIVHYMIFFRIQYHAYYQMIYLPLISIIAAYGMKKISVLISFLLKYFININYPQKHLWFIGCNYLLLLAVYNSLFSGRFFTPDMETLRILETIRKFTPQKGLVLFVFPNFDYSSAYTYYTGKKGMAKSVSEVEEKKIKTLSEEGYQYLVVGKPYQIVNNSNYKMIKEKFRILGGDKYAEVYNLK